MSNRTEVAVVVRLVDYSFGVIVGSVFDQENGSVTRRIGFEHGLSPVEL